MDSSLQCKTSPVDRERHKTFFPALGDSSRSNFFRPWADQESDGFLEENCLQEATDKQDTGEAVSVSSNGSDSTYSEPSSSTENRSFDTGVDLRSDGPRTLDTTLTSAKGRRQRRKSSRPHRSATAHDPTFRGVTISVQTRLWRMKRSKRWQSQLLIKSFFTVRGRGFPRTCRTRHPSCGDSFGDTSSDSDETRRWSLDDLPGPPTQQKKLYLRYQRPPQIFGYSGKQCASCCVRRTPLWRDAEDGTPLCNACGIRYKKYRVRCGGCWLIPRKDGKSFTNCSRCGQEFRVAVFRRSNKPELSKAGHKG